MKAKDVSEMLSKRAQEVAMYLLPNGKMSGSEWCVGSVDGEAGKSLKVHVTGEKAGIWADFQSGESGDLIDLWALTKRMSLSEALHECRTYLGLIEAPRLYTPPSKAKQYKKPNSTYSQLSSSTEQFNYLRIERKLSAETIALFRVQQTNDSIVFPYYVDNEVVFLKYLKLARENGKKIMWTEKDCQPILFGWHALPFSLSTVTLCEGEIDAMSLRDVGVYALSVPFGGGSGRKHEWIENEFKRLEQFDEIFLCFDHDETGMLAVREVAERLGSHRCRAVMLPMKDANECLQSGFDEEDFKFYFDRAKHFDPDELVDVINFKQDTWDYAYPKPGDYVGYLPLWEKAQDKIAFRQNELCMWTGMNGHGKTQFLGQVMLQLMNQGARICIASMEFKPKVLLHRMLRQMSARKEWSQRYHDAMFDWLHNKVWIFDLQGTALANRLLEVFLYARKRYGIDVFLIDSFTTLDFREDDYNGQKAFVEKLRDFKNQHNCQIHMVAHPRKGADETQLVGKYDIRGTAAVTDLADSCFSVWRNKAKEDVNEKQKRNEMLTDKEMDLLNAPDCLWRCDKQRNGDWEGKLAFWFDKASLQYLESSSRKPKPYLEFSCLETS